VNRTTSRSIPRACAALCAAFLLAATPARGVIIDTATGTGNTTAPVDNPGWANVGTVANGSAVYLGNRWAITATHVWTGPTTFSGTTYQNVPGSEITLSNNGAAGKTPYTDLVLYQLATDPGLPALTIASSTPANGSAVTMIGAGRDRGAFTTWNVNTGTTPWVWTVSGSNANAAGYLWGSTRTMRWGTNAVEGAGWITYTIDTAKSAYVMQTTFNDLGTFSNEAQAAPGDSGGAMFRKNGSTWELSGIMLVTDAFSGQPGSTAVFGNNTFSADLSYYRSQIVQVVPEPGALMLAGLGSITLVVAASRRRRRLPR
jgi:hypothetical protein